MGIPFHTSVNRSGRFPIIIGIEREEAGKKTCWTRGAGHLRATPPNPLSPSHGMRREISRKKRDLP